MDRVSASEAGDGCSNQPGSKERAGRRAIVGSAPKAHQPLAEIPRGRTRLNLNSIFMGYPFRGEVQRLENQEHPEIKQLSENPNKVVREVLTPNREWLQAKIGAYREARDYFYDLRDNYGIAVPAIDFLAGENEHSQKKLFVVVDKISGKNVKSETWYPLEAAEEFDFFYSQLLQSFFDAYKNKEPYWSDFHDAQIVYGKKKWRC